MLKELKDAELEEDEDNPLQPHHIRFSYKPSNFVDINFFFCILIYLQYVESLCGGCNSREKSLLSRRRTAFYLITVLYYLHLLSRTQLKIPLTALNNHIISKIVLFIIYTITLNLCKYLMV